MSNGWRRLAAGVALMTAVAVPARDVGAQATRDAGDRAGASEVQVDEMEPVEETGEGDVVHSWTLVPASDDGGQVASYRPNLSYELTPGAKVEDAVTVFNYGTVPLTFEVFATDAFNNADGEFDLLSTDEEPDGVGTWVTIAQRHVTVPANGQATLPISIDVPADARPGDHVGGVLASAPVEGTSSDGRLVRFDRRTGTRLYVRVDGRLDPSLALVGVRTGYRPSLNPLDGTAVVTYRIENRGNVRLGAEHRASVSGPLGLLEQRSDRTEIKEILPGESVTVRTPISGVSAALAAFTDVTVEPVLIGDGGETPTVSGSAVTAAPPWTVLALAVAAALALAARRAYRRHGATRTTVPVFEPGP